MKLIEAVVSVDKIEHVCEVIKEFVSTYAIVHGDGRSAGRKAVMRARRGTETYEMDYNPMAVITFVIVDDIAEKIVSLVADAAFTGDLSDGTISVQTVDYVLNIGSKTKL